MTYDFQDYQQSKRLHPLTLLYKFIVSSPQIAIPIYFATRGDFESWIYLIIIFVVLMFTIPGIILHYYYFSFSITPKELIVRSGIIAKKQRNIPIQRIQNINFEENILQRLLGLTKIAVETAGDNSTEANLEFVSKADALEIKQIIKEYQEQLQSKSPENKEIKDSNENASVDDEQSTGDNTIKTENGQSKHDIFNMSIKDCMVYGMLRFRPLVLIAAFWIWSFMQQFTFMPQFRDIDITDYIDDFSTLDVFNLALYIGFAVLFIFVISWIFDILLTINQFYDFKLKLEGNKLNTSYGLLTKRTVTIPLKKLQMLVISTNFIRKKFNFYSMDINTAGFGSNTKASEAVIPLAGLERLINLAQIIKRFNFPEKFREVSRLTIRRALVRYFIFIVVPFIAFIYFVLPFEWFALLGLTPLLYFAALLRWRHRGFWIDDDFVIVKHGFIFQRISIIPIAKIQSLHVTATIFQRRLGLASLNIDTAAFQYFSDATIVDIAEEDADLIMQELSEKFHDLEKNKAVL